ncbi:MAG: flavodoxin domain-containing protein [Anaerolineales bacterium]
MDNKFLVAYGTMAGSTAEVAQAIAEEMRSGGLLVDLKPVEEVKDISGYQGLVLGTAVRAFRILGKTKRFLRKHRKAMQSIPVAYFLVCLTMSEETPENIERATSFAKPMIKIKEPVSLGLFGGALIHENLKDIFGKALKSVPEQDNRDWNKIRAWGREMVDKLS